MQCLLFWKCLIMSQQLLGPNGLALYQQEQVQPVRALYQPKTGSTCTADTNSMCHQYRNNKTLDDRFASFSFFTVPLDHVKVTGEN